MRCFNCREIGHKQRNCGDKSARTPESKFVWKPKQQSIAVVLSSQSFDDMLWIELRKLHLLRPSSAAVNRFIIDTQFSLYEKSKAKLSNVFSDETLSIKLRK